MSERRVVGWYLRQLRVQITRDVSMTDKLPLKADVGQCGEPSSFNRTLTWATCTRGVVFRASNGKSSLAFFNLGHGATPITCKNVLQPTSVYSVFINIFFLLL